MASSNQKRQTKLPFSANKAAAMELPRKRPRYQNTTTPVKNMRNEGSQTTLGFPVRLGTAESMNPPLSRSTSLVEVQSELSVFQTNGSRSESISVISAIPDVRSVDEDDELDCSVGQLQCDNVGLLDDTSVLEDNVPFSDDLDADADAELHTYPTPTSFEQTSTGSDVSETQMTNYFESLRKTIRDSFGSEWEDINEFLQATYEAKDGSDLKDEFEEFRSRESILSGWNPAYLVTPSGDPGHQLHMKLNYPTFRTQRLEYGESADDSNNSTNLLIRKGLNSSNAFWFESCFRRQTPTSSRHQECATKLWPAEVNQIHSDFSQKCEGFGKKVLLLFGAPNRKELNRRYAVTERIIKAAPTELVTIGIMRNFNGSIRYLVVYCPHPEWLLWNWTTWAGRFYDACVNVASALVGLTLSPHLFEERAKCVKVVATQKTALRDADTTRKLEKQNKVRCHPDDLPPSILQYAADNGISVDRLNSQYQVGWSVAQLVYDFIQSRQPPSSSWNKGVRMPRNLPRNLPTQNRAFKPTSFPAIPTSASSVPVKIVPNATKSKNPIVRSAVVHLGREVHLMCIRCGLTPRSKPIDRKPVFVTISAAKGKYIAQRQACATPACIPKGRKGQIDQFMVPQNPNIPFIRSDNLNKIKITQDATSGI